jgi:acyl-CoA synthetase (AMP-forming)/AMP-acid ligase II
MKLWNYIKKKMLDHPQQVVCENNTQISYKGIVLFAESFADQIRDEQCCAILCNSEILAALALLSCFAADVTAVPLSARYGQAHCNKILDTISPTAIISDCNGELKIHKLTDTTYKPPAIHPAIIMCTSGTTGSPKGAMLTEDNILTNVQDIADYFDITTEDKILISRPLYHCAVLTGEFLTSLIKGAKIRFYSGEFNPKVLIDIISQYGISIFCGTPTLIGMLARFKDRETKTSLTTICISGECMSTTVGHRIINAFPFTEIYHVYGLTEACPRVSYLPPKLFSQYPECVGVPLNSVSLRIVKPDGSIATSNEEGVLWVKGDNVMVGYYNAPEQTEKVLKDGWLCTGDIAVIDSNGLLRIKGRADNLIIRAGMNIYPQEIESSLKTDNRVREVFVYKIDNNVLGVRIGLKVSGDFASVDEVRTLCNRILPSFQIPSVIELLDELPKNGSGKIIRK